MSDALARVDAPGIYTMTAAAYHADPCPEPSLSSSIASLLCHETPAHARHAHPRLNPHLVRTETEDYDIGTLAHQILLEGVNRVESLPYHDWRTKAAREARDQARAAGRIPLLAKDWLEVAAMLQATRAQLDAHVDGRSMFRDGAPEQTLIWRDPLHNCWCRARLDWLRDGGRAVDDYKSTRATANPETLSRTLYDRGWDVQVAFYLRGVKVLTGHEAEFRFAVQECFAPYALAVVALGPAALLLGEKKVLYALEAWGACLARNTWPSYPTRTAYLGLPPFIEEAWLRKEEQETHAV